MEPEPKSAETIAGDSTTPTSALPWSQARERLAAAQTYWLATSRVDGSPHVRPVLGVWFDGSLFTTTSPAASKAGNITRDGRCSLTTSTDGMDLVVEGKAARLDNDTRLAAVAAVYQEKYQWPATVHDGAFEAPYGAPTAGPPPYVVYEVTPRVVFGFGTNEELAPRSTRWRF